MLVKFNIFALFAIPVFFGALFASHSAVGFGILAVILFLAFLTSRSVNKKLLMLVFGIFAAIAFAAYFSGSIGGGEQERTAKKFALGEDSELIVRSFIRPFNLLKEAVSDYLAGFVWGFGFRAPQLNSIYLPMTGDNNYFSVFADLGIFGFLLFLYFLYNIYIQFIKLKKNSISFRGKIIIDTSKIWFVSILLAMFSQEILWPLHSRGNSSIVLLILIVLPFTIFRKRSNQGGRGLS